MRIVIHREIPDDPDLQTHWNTLVRQEQSPEVFYTYQWALAVQRAYRSSLIPFLVLLHDDEKLVGIASLATDPDNRVAHFLAGTTADYCDFLSSPEHRTALVEASFAELAKLGVPKIELANLPADSFTVAALRSASATHRFRIFLRPAYLCAQVDLGIGESRKNLKTAILRKSTFRRAMAKLENPDPVTLTNLRCWSELESAIPQFFTAHVARFLATGRISNIASAERRVFLTQLAQLTSTAGWINLSQLRAGSRAVAWNYGFQFSGSWFWYQPTFETSYEPMSPGYCLLAKLIAEACDTPDMQRFDMGLGAEGYKERFANRTRSTVHGTMTRSCADHAKVAARYSLVNAVAHSPKLDGVLRKARTRISVRVQELGPAALLGRIARRIWSFAWTSEEILFYRWPARRQAGLATDPEFHLAPLDLHLLASTQMQFPTEKTTSDYLLRSAHRLLNSRACGFALLDKIGMPVHFCWSDRFDGFSMAEFDTRLEEEDPLADLIFDCWTPPAFRGHGYYARAIADLASSLSRNGRNPWIFSAATNLASVRGIEEAGFERQYSMVQRTTLGRKSLCKIAGTIHPPQDLPVAS